jgi:hypothetical protein
MPVTAIFDVPRMTAQQYDQIMAKLNDAGASAPDGRLYHVASPKGNGWLVVDVWESPEKLQAFAQTLMPIVQSVGVTPPTPEVLPAHNIIKG